MWLFPIGFKQKIVQNRTRHPAAAALLNETLRVRPTVDQRLAAAASGTRQKGTSSLFSSLSLSPLPLQIPIAFRKNPPRFFQLRTDPSELLNKATWRHRRSDNEFGT